MCETKLRMPMKQSPSLDENRLHDAVQVGLVFSIYSFASVAASPLFGRLVQLGYFKRRTLLLSGLLVVT